MHVSHAYSGRWHELMMISLPLRNTQHPLPTTAASPQRLTHRHGDTTTTKKGGKARRRTASTELRITCPGPFDRNRVLLIISALLLIRAGHDSYSLLSRVGKVHGGIEKKEKTGMETKFLIPAVASFALDASSGLLTSWRC